MSDTGQKKIFYGWVICGLCLTLNFLCTGLTTTGLSLHFPYVITELGLSNTQMSMITTTRCISTVIAASFSNEYYTRFSLRQGTALMGALLVAAYLGLSQVNSAIGYYLMAALMGVVYALGSAVPIALLMHNWFISLRPIATAFSLCGSSIFAIIAPPLLAMARSSVGLQRTYLIEAAVVLIMTIVLFTFLRDKPEYMGLKPYMRDSEKLFDHVKNRQLAHKNSSLNGKFSVFLISVFLIGGTSSAITGSMTLHFTHAGYTETLVNRAMSIFGISLFCGKFFYSFLIDRFGHLLSGTCFLGLWSLSAFIAAFINGESLPMLLMASVLLGAGHATAIVGVIDWTEELSTDETYTKNTERSQLCFSAGAVIITMVPGIIADVTGSYLMSFVLLGALLLLVLLLIRGVFRQKSTN